MKIYINESQARLLNEQSVNTVSDNMRESIAVWCLLNDFRYFNPNRIIGRGTSVANDDETNKEICNYIMNTNDISLANEYKNIFRIDDTDEEYNIYKVNIGEGYILIEVSSDDVYEMFCEDTMQDLEWGDIENDLLEWFYQTYR